LEVEAKFSVPDEGTFQRLLATSTLAGFSLDRGTVTQVHDRYLDTAEGALHANGYACRVRCEDGRTLASLKGLGSASGAIHHRAEVEVALPEPLLPHDWPPSAARDLVLRLCGQQVLSPLFDLEQIRHRRCLHQGSRAVAELALDRVRVLRGETLASTYLELEAELLQAGHERDLRRLSVELQEQWGLAPQSRSKFERGLELFGLNLAFAKEASWIVDVHLPLKDQPVDSVPGQEHRPQEIELLQSPGIEPNDPMSEAGRKTFQFHYRRMLYHEPGTRQGRDIEALHDMRVATRRMRAAFRVFGDFYDPKAVAPYLKGLKRIGRALGPVRDLDVFRAQIEAYQSTLPASEQASLNRFQDILEGQREAARQRMIAYLDGEKYARFKVRFGKFTETQGMGSPTVVLQDSEPSPYRVRHIAPMAVYERLAAVRAYDEWVSIPDPPPQRLHSLRIACKRLRYTLEFFLEVLGPDTKTLIKDIVALQDHLGELQDAVVAGSLLRDFLDRGIWGHTAVDEPASQAPLDEPGVAAYLAFKQAELHHLLETFPEVWQRINSDEFRRMVAEAVVVL
jgi:CHAD domain-containing protein